MHVNRDGVVVTSKLGTHAGNQPYNSRMKEIEAQAWMVWWGDYLDSWPPHGLGSLCA